MQSETCTWRLKEQKKGRDFYTIITQASSPIARACDADNEQFQAESKHFSVDH